MIKVAYILGKVHSGGKKNLVLEYLRHVDTQKVRIDFICDSDSNSIPEEEVKFEEDHSPVLFGPVKR